MKEGVPQAEQRLPQSPGKGVQGSEGGSCSFLVGFQNEGACSPGQPLLCRAAQGWVRAWLWRWQCWSRSCDEALSRQGIEDAPRGMAGRLLRPQACNVPCVRRC